jgi:hypothetical protein
VNIFVTDPDPVLSAQALDDLRLNKMILESAQMLSDAIHDHAKDLAPLVYKRSRNFNHPCTIWVRESRENYFWLLTHCIALIFEKLYRTWKPHRSITLIDTFREALFLMPAKPGTEFVNCSFHREIESVYTAYRQTLLEKWITSRVKESFSWTRRAPPDWLEAPTRVENGVTRLVVGE